MMLNVGRGFVGAPAGLHIVPDLHPSTPLPHPPQASNPAAADRPRLTAAAAAPTCRNHLHEVELCSRCGRVRTYCNSLCLACFELMQDIRAGDWQD